MMMIITASGLIYGQPKSVFVQLEFHIEKMNNGTDCQLLTICHRWQPVRKNKLISLLLTLYLLCKPVIIPHSIIMYKCNCNRFCFLQVSIWLRTIRNHHLSSCVAL